MQGGARYASPSAVVCLFFLLAGTAVKKKSYAGYSFGFDSFSVSHAQISSKAKPGSSTKVT